MRNAVHAPQSMEVTGFSLSDRMPLTNCSCGIIEPYVHTERCIVNERLPLREVPLGSTTRHQSCGSGLKLVIKVLGNFMVNLFCSMTLCLEH